MKWAVFIFEGLVAVTTCIEAGTPETANNTQTVSLNTRNDSSTCFVKSQSELSSIKKTLLISSVVDMELLGRTLHNLILNLEKSIIEVTDDGFTMPCEIVDLCEDHYSLEALLDRKLGGALRFKTDFFANGLDSIFYITKDNQLQIIDKSEFQAFQVGNTYIKLVNNSVSTLVLYELGAQRILTNDNSGNCKCPSSANLNTLFKAQQNMRVSLLHYMQDFTVITETLSLVLDSKIAKCIQNYRNGVKCSHDHKNRKKRSIFSLFDTDSDMRQVSQIFNDNFRKLELAENSKNRLLGIMRQQLLSEKLELKAVIRYLNAYSVLEQSHLNSVKLTNEMWSMLQLLSHKLETADIRNILRLLLKPSSTCHFISKFNSCMKVKSFAKINKTSIEINFYHSLPKLILYRSVLCVPQFINGSFMINEAHNIRIYGNEVLDTTKLRNVTSKDFLIPNLPVIGVDMFLVNGTSCSILICLQNLSFLQEKDIKSCELNEKITVCGQFTLTFEEGVISHINIEDQNLIAQLESHHEQLTKLSETVVMVNKNHENEENVNLQDVQSIFITEDMLKMIGVILGSLLFLSCIFLIIYLKCKNELKGSYHPPYLSRRYREPYTGSLMVQFDQSAHEPQLSQSTLTEMTEDNVNINPSAAIQLHPPQTGVASYVVSRGSAATVLPQTGTGSLLSGFSQL